MNTWTDIILTLDLGILITISFYNCIPQRKMHTQSKVIRSFIGKRMDIVYCSVIFLSILTIGGVNVYMALKAFLLCCIIYAIFKALGEKIRNRSLLILNDEVKECFTCTLINLTVFIFLTMHWKRSMMILPSFLSCMVVINSAMLLLLCLRLIWNGMISIEKVPKKEEGIKIIFVNSFSIICVVILVLSAMVYWLSVWDALSYQINGTIGSLTLIDSVYYTITTITTVGYGDIAPISEYSRILAIVVQTIGLLIISGFAVNVISFITSRGK